MLNKQQHCLITWAHLQLESAKTPIVQWQCEGSVDLVQGNVSVRAHSEGNEVKTSHATVSPQCGKPNCRIGWPPAVFEFEKCGSTVRKRCTYSVNQSKGLHQRDRIKAFTLKQLREVLSWACVAWAVTAATGAAAHWTMWSLFKNFSAAQFSLIWSKIWWIKTWRRV